MVRPLALFALMLPHALAAMLLYGAPLLVGLLGLRGMAAPNPFWMECVAAALGLAHGLGLSVTVLLPDRGRLLALPIGLLLALCWFVWGGVGLTALWRAFQESPHVLAALQPSGTSLMYGSLLATHGVPLASSVAMMLAGLRVRWPVIMAVLLPLGCGAVGLTCRMLSMKQLWGVYWTWEPELMALSLYLGTLVFGMAALVLTVWTRSTPEDEAS